MESLISEPTLIKIQAGSGVVFSTFLSLHLTNTIVSNNGQLFYDEIQRIFRTFYQNPIIEPVILGSLAVHLSSCFLRFIRRNKNDKKLNNKLEEAKINNKPEIVQEIKDIIKLSEPVPSLKVHRLSGYTLSVFVGGHIVAARIIPLIFNDKADFTLMSFSLEHWPLLFYPYFFVLGSSGVYHMAHGLVQAKQVLISSKNDWRKTTESTIFRVLVGITAISVASGILAFGGKYFSVNKSRYDVWYKLYNTIYPEFFIPWKK